MDSYSNYIEGELVKETTAQDWLMAGIRWWGLMLLTLHLAAVNLPEETSWSLWPYTLLPPWLGWTLALLAGTLVISAVNQWVSDSLGRLWLAVETRFLGKSQVSKQVWLFGVALLAGGFFWLARLRHLRWGDGYVLTIALAYDGPGGPVIYNWQAPLTVFLHQRLWQFVAHPWLGWPVETVYATVSIICGVIFVYLMLTFLIQLGRNRLERAILAGLVLTTGSMQLFFGYVENYTLISLGLGLVLFLSWQALRGEIKPVWPVLALSLTNGFHPSTVCLWPGMIWLSWLCWRRDYVSLRGGIWQTLLPPLFIAAGVLALMESGEHGLAALLGDDRPGGGDGLWFVPLFETTTQWQHYTMFSVAHLLDWGNEHLLLSPFGLPLLGMMLVTWRRFRLTLFEQTMDRDYASVLGVMSAGYLLFTWLWNPDYGGRKDWDLFAPSAFVYTLLAGYLLVRILPRKEKLREAGLLVGVISLLHSAAWIFANTHSFPHD